MSEPFIRPNWHVIAIHFPLGVLSLGIILEWLSWIWGKSGMRSGARWMILMGALLTIPATALGIFAFRDVVVPEGMEDAHWRDLMQASPWSQVQWQYMVYHTWLEALGTGLAVLLVTAWLAGSDRFRKGMYWPGLIVLTGALGLMVAGAWFAGESVYRYGTAVQAAVAAPGDVVAAHDAHDAVADTQAADQAAVHTHESNEEEEHEHEDIAWIAKYLPPMELHLLLAGVAVAFAAAGIGVSIRRWSQPDLLPALAIPAVRVTSPGPVVQEGAPAATPAQPIAPVPVAPVQANVPQPIFAARFWLAALLFGLGSGALGLWMNNDWRLEALTDPIRSKQLDAGHDRLFWHVAFALSIVLFTLIMAVVTRVSRRAKGVIIFFVLLLVIAVSLQVWTGVLMLYDSPHGPMTGFAR